MGVIPYLIGGWALAFAGYIALNGYVKNNGRNYRSVKPLVKKYRKVREDLNESNKSNKGFK